MISALITLYNPNSDSVTNVDIIGKQVDRVILCDNSKCDNGELFAGIENCIYIKNKRNLGLSKAFNRPLRNKRLQWKDDDFIIFFDQDSRVEEDHISKMVSEYTHILKRGINIGCMGASFYDVNSKENYSADGKRISRYSYAVRGVITSSMLTQYGTLKRIGFWNEKLFLDFADWDICWRLVRAGYIPVKTLYSSFDHSIGKGKKNVAGLRIRQADSIREYYQTKSFLYLLTKKYTPITNKLKFIRNLVIRPIAHLLFLDDKKKRMKYIFAAFVDSFKGYYGSYEDRP